MKYITFCSAGKHTMEVDLFSPFVSHEEQAKRLQLSRQEIVGAGFCRIDGNGQVECSGFSTSLGVGPADHDAALISACIKHTNEMYPAHFVNTDLFPAPQPMRYRASEPERGEPFTDLAKRSGSGSEL